MSKRPLRLKLLQKLECPTLDKSIQMMTDEIVSALGDNTPSIYLYGSVVMNDFQLGWSDIDILVLTQKEISDWQAETLVSLRQALSECYLDNPCYRLFEGGMISLEAFLLNQSERAVYWGTSGQRVTDKYSLDSFGMAELFDCGILLYGDDIRSQMTYPTYAHMRDDIACHVQAARKYGTVVGWLLDIARGIYTLRTGKVIAKTVAGEWALTNKLCPNEDAMRKAVRNRKEPWRGIRKEKEMDNAVIQQFADVIEGEFTSTIQLLAESELYRMNIAYDTISLIRDKDGVSVWRVVTSNDSVVLKCFDKPEYRREIANYQILSSLDIPTLKIIAHTDCSLLMEDIERSVYRLGAMEDINDSQIAGKIALWYKALHENGREYANTHELPDECDGLTTETLKAIQEKTGTSELDVWRVIEEYFEQIRTAAINLPRTLVYTDFHYSNLAVARDGSSALVFDYNFLFKSYAYSDIRNVCGNFYNADAMAAFMSTCGPVDEWEIVVDDVVSVIMALNIACQRKVFPEWANGLLDRVKDGRLLTAVEKLVGEEMNKQLHATMNSSMT